MTRSGVWRGVCCVAVETSGDYLHLIEWLRSYFVGHKRPIKREGSRALETLDAS